MKLCVTTTGPRNGRVTWTVVPLALSHGVLPPQPVDDYSELVSSTGDIYSVHTNPDSTICQSNAHT